MKQLWLFLCGGAVKNLEKKENEALDAFEEGEFRRTLQRLAPSEAEFYGK